MRKKRIPEPDIDRNIVDMLYPIERTAEDFVLKQLRRFFGVRAIRAYFTMIFFGYLFDQVNINFSERRFKFEINNQQEFILYASVYLSFVIILGLLDFRESKFFSELEQNERMWHNYVINIQPNIEDPDKKLMAMYSFKLEKTSNDLRDYFIKIVDEYIKEIIEEVSDLNMRQIDFENLLREFEPLKDLALQLREKKQKRTIR